MLHPLGDPAACFRARYCLRGAHDRLVEGRRWEQVAAGEGPPARFAAGVTYDSKPGLTIIFGGIGVDGKMLADLWAWNGSSWIRLSDSSASGPLARSMGHIAYDKKRDRTVLFGGRKGWPVDLADT
jgi:hypothetical protein